MLVLVDGLFAFDLGLSPGPGLDLALDLGLSPGA